jgi:perosamine synthetase
MNIPLFKPNLGSDELSALKDIFESGWIGLGPKTAAFEEALAAYQSRRFAVGLNSCTAALHLAIEALDLPPDAEVIVPTITFASTAHAVEYCGRTVRFVDSRVDDLCIDIDSFSAASTSKTAAVIPVHMGGQPCRIDEVCAIAKKHNIVVIEDVANAQGGSYKGKKLGSWGELGAFSFEAKKNMTTGDGGMLVFDNEKYLEHLKKMRWCGINKDTWKRFADAKTSGYSWYYDIDCLGYKYNMNDIAAAIGLVQLAKLDTINAQKRTLMKRYISELSGLGDLYIPPYDLETGGYWLFIIQTSHRDALMDYLSQKGVTCGVHFMPIHLHPYYKEKYPDTHLPQSEKVFPRFMSLPLFASMTEEQQSYIISCIKPFFETSV